MSIENHLNKEKPVNWKNAPKITKLPDDLTIKGFNYDRELFVKSLLEGVGLPVNKVPNVSYKYDFEGNPNTAGTAHMLTGEVVFYKRMENMPEIAQLGVAVHELMHVNSPFSDKNKEAYGSEDEILNAQKNTDLVADQTIETHKFLNGYHKNLYEDFNTGKIDKEHFVEETSAIMTELRFTNPKHLEEVLKSQKVALGNSKPDLTKTILDQLDKTLLILIPQLKSKEDLDTHIKKLKESYKKDI